MSKGICSEAGIILNYYNSATLLFADKELTVDFFCSVVINNEYSEVPLAAAAYSTWVNK